MTTRTRLFIEKLALTPKRLFLIDSVGAFCTAFFLAAILATFEQFFGMPRKVLYPLALAVCGYSIYSGCCYFFATGSSWRSYLKLIMVANFLYCLLSIALVVYFYKQLTVWGVVYFFTELLVLAALILIEKMTIAGPDR